MGPLGVEIDPAIVDTQIRTEYRRIERSFLERQVPGDRRLLHGTCHVQLTAHCSRQTLYRAECQRFNTREIHFFQITLQVQLAPPFFAPVFSPRRDVVVVPGNIEAHRVGVFCEIVCPQNHVSHDLPGNRKVADFDVRGERHLFALISQHNVPIQHPPDQSAVTLDNPGHCGEIKPGKRHCQLRVGGISVRAVE